jgi:hypothetical protein
MSDTTFEPYTARHKPPKADTGRLYRPRQFNRVSRTRFERNRIGELVRHLGRPASFPERIIINRIVAIEWELLRTDAKLDRGLELSGHDIRGRLAAETRLRLDLVALGLQPPVEKPIDAIEYGRQLDARRTRGAP